MTVEMPTPAELRDAAHTVDLTICALEDDGARGGVLLTLGSAYDALRYLAERDT